MKKLLRFLLIILFISSFDTTTYAMMVDQKSAQVEQKIPKIQARSPYALYYEIDNLLKNQCAPKDIVAALKRQKIDVNVYGNDPQSQSNDFGWTALHIAVWQKPSPTKIKIPQILIDAGADVNARIIHPRSYYDWAPLHLAVRMSPEYVPVLLDAHADVDALINDPNGDPRVLTYHGFTPLGIAVRHSEQPMYYELIRSLVAYGADIRSLFVILKHLRPLDWKAESRSQIMNAMIHGRMDRIRARARQGRPKKQQDMQELIKLFNEWQLPTNVPGVNTLAVAYHGGELR